MGTVLEVDDHLPECEEWRLSHPDIHPCICPALSAYAERLQDASPSESGENHGVLDPQHENGFTNGLLAAITLIVNESTSTLDRWGPVRARLLRDLEGMIPDA